MRSPTAALVLEMWCRNRKWITLIGAITTFGWILNLLLPGHKATDHNSAIGGLFMLLFGIALVMLFAIFNYTEFDPRTGSSGFPRRLFTLPVSSFRLVAVPLVLGVASAEFFGLTSRILLSSGVNPIAAVKIGTFMIVYQTILWTCARLGALRPLILGVIAIVFIFVGFDPMVAEEDITTTSIAMKLVPVAIAAFVISWMYVANQRSGGGRLRIRYKPITEILLDSMPRRSKAFPSPTAAQFWLEWRRSGVVLPICVGVLLVIAIAPLSWQLRDDADSTLLILAVVLAMPILLSLPIGKGLSKPDFWSTELSLPAFLAVRPLSTRDYITVKMKVAACSTAVAWSMVFLFLAIWLPFIAKFDKLERLRAMVGSLYANASYAPPLIAVLLAMALMVVTWRFLVSGLWIGLSGSRRLFEFSAAPYGVVPVFGLIALIVLPQRHSDFLDWSRTNLDTYLPIAVGILFIALCVKLAIGIFSAGKIARPYLALWLAATILLMVLALLLTQGAGVLLPSSSTQIRNALLLLALLLVPLGRLTLAPRFLEKNRHH